MQKSLDIVAVVALAVVKGLARYMFEYQVNKEIQAVRTVRIDKGAIPGKTSIPPCSGFIDHFSISICLIFRMTS